MIIDAYLQHAPPFPESEPSESRSRSDRWKVIAGVSLVFAIGALAWAFLLRGT